MVAVWALQDDSHRKSKRDCSKQQRWLPSHASFLSLVACLCDGTHRQFLFVSWYCQLEITVEYRGTRIILDNSKLLHIPNLN